MFSWSCGNWTHRKIDEGAFGCSTGKTKELDASIEQLPVALWSIQSKRLQFTVGQSQQRQELAARERSHLAPGIFPRSLSSCMFSFLWNWAIGMHSYGIFPLQFLWTKWKVGKNPMEVESYEIPWTSNLFDWSCVYMSGSHDRYGWIQFGGIHDQLELHLPARPGKCGDRVLGFKCQ
jgi:hypothetical protein